MKALRWYGPSTVKIDDVAEPEIVNPRDAVIKITSTAICGSDIHIYDGYIPSMVKGDILGHEFMGYVVDAGSGVNNLKIGDRVLIPFPISCGNCYFCQHEMWSLCDNSNPNAGMVKKLYGYSPAAIYGYSHLFGGYSGGQAEYVRVPYADVNHIQIPGALNDEQVLFLTDIFPTGYQAAENCNIQPGDTIAVWGCGPVGLFAIKSAFMLGAARVIAIDRYPERLELAAQSGAEVVNYSLESDLLGKLQAMTGDRGPDACIDAVGLEAHADGVLALYDRAKQAMRLETDRPYVIRQVINACRKGGTISLAGAYGGVVDKILLGAAFNKGLTLKMGQTHVHKYLKPLLELIERGEIDPSFIITHRISLDDAPDAYKMFRDKKDGCIKVVLKP